MVRKVIWSSGLGTILLLFFFGRDCLSYIGTSAGWVKDSVRSSVPVSFEIERARKMVQDLLPDIRRSMHVIAKEEVEIEQLDKEIKTGETRLAKEKDEVLRLKGDVATPKEQYVYAGRYYTVQQVKLDLANRFERFKTSDATLQSLRDIREARTRGLDAARKKLEGMLAAKRQLEVDVENLEARLKMVEVAQTTSDVNIDDSQLGRAKELVTQLRTRLQVAERMVNAEGQYRGEIQIEDPEAANIVDQVTDYFHGSTAEESTATDKSATDKSVTDKTAAMHKVSAN